MWPVYPPEPPQLPEPPRERPDATPLYARKRKDSDQPPPLEQQFEDLLGQVWDSERRERMNDRIDQAIRNDEARAKSNERRRRKANHEL